MALATVFGLTMLSAGAQACEGMLKTVEQTKPTTVATTTGGATPMPKTGS